MRAFINRIINNKILMIGAMIIIIAIVTCFPFLRTGIYGFNKDVIYHLFRIDGLADCIVNGQLPSRIYNNFFDGYGYGSPMFYPDILMLPAALFRIIGLNLSMTYKLYVLLITVIATFTTYYSAKVIIKDFRLAVVATYMIMLSQFYLANIMSRAGLSEYLGYIFLPLVFAGIYDFFKNDGKRVYLLGIGFGGMILSHTLLAFIGGIVTAGFFIVGIICDIVSKQLSKRGHQYIKLIITAVLTLLIVGFYLFPMIEQLLSVEMGVNTPWTFVGNNTQPLYTLFIVNGYFEMIAYVGIGIPLLILMGVRVFYSRVKNAWSDAFYFGGIALFIVTTNIIPWYLCNNTFLNSIQFTFRWYPYAIFALTVGSLMIIDSAAQSKDMNNIITRIVIVFVALSIAFGSWENLFTMSRVEKPDFYTDINTIDMTTTYEVGEGREWLPVKANDVYLSWSSDDKVRSGNTDVLCTRQSGEVIFNTIPSATDYVCPLTYYKGYKAKLTDSNGQVYDLQVTESDTGQVQVINDLSVDGEVRVYYGNTFVQIISLIISIITILAVVIYIVLSKRGIFVGKSYKKDQVK